MSEVEHDLNSKYQYPQSICTTPKRDRDLTGMECLDRFKTNFEKRDWNSLSWPTFFFLPY